jgi:hypothetical protein
MTAQVTDRVPRPRCTKCTKTSCGCHRENHRNATVNKGTSIQGLEHKEQKTEKTRDSPSFDPHTIVFNGNRGNGIKRAARTIKRKGSTTILLDRQGLRTREAEEKWNLPSFDQLAMEWTKFGRKEHDFHNSNNLIVPHDLGAKSAQDYPMVHSDEVSPQRPRRCLGLGGASIQGS